MNNPLSSSQARGSLLIAVLALILSWQSLAIDLLVSNTNDSGAGSLRQAIADNDTLGGGGTIIFSNNITGTITLTNGQLMIFKDLTLIGPGANVLAISGNHASRVFYISNSATVNISGLTLTAGAGENLEAGAILNTEATLTISNCNISGNSTRYAGAILNDHGTLSLISSTFSGNSAERVAGAIYNDGNFTSATAVIINCTFSGNSVGLAGGAILNNGYQGNASLSVISSTFSNNTCALANQAAAIQNELGTVTIRNSILAAGAAAINVINNPGTVISLGFNLYTDSSSSPVLTNTTDQINTDPKLGPLSDNGGPTPTHRLLAGSPAIDKGKSFGLITDQRGLLRSFDFGPIPDASGGDGTDIGAFESQPPTLNIAQSGQDVVLSWFTNELSFTLEWTTTLNVGSSWSNAPGTPSIVGTQYALTNPAVGSSKFYRLRSP